MAHIAGNLIMNKYDLAWGNSVCVREAFIKTYNKTPLLFGPDALSKFDYPEHHGDKGLISITADVIMRQFGLSYKHIFITSGATGGCVISLRAYAQMGYDNCVTREAPYYIRYPKMIESAGLNHLTARQLGNEDDREVILLDLPSNPQGLMTTLYQTNSPVILDAVYLNEVYMNPMLIDVPPHDVLVGSYSKLLGINGIRLGWMATNDDVLAAKMGELVTSEYCGLSTASQEILKSALTDFDWDSYGPYARFKLDLNRENFQKLEKYFGETPITGIGMFYYAPTDKKCRELLEKANIHYTKGSAMGTTDEFGRFNLGQDNQIVDQAVKAILKADKI